MNPSVQDDGLTAFAGDPNLIPDPVSSLKKPQLRRLLRQQRNALSPDFRRQASLSLLKVAVRSRLLMKFQRIGFYLPFDSEMDLLPLLNHALWQKKRCYLPVVPRHFERKLGFSPIASPANWYLNRFGIHEYWTRKLTRARQLDLLLMPLVGFDLYGYRLGMGGGFYDTSLAYLRRRNTWKKPYLIGIAYECQKVDAVPHEAWDVRLNAVLTEKQLYRFAGSARQANFAHL